VHVAIYAPFGGGIPRNTSGSTMFTAGGQGQPVALPANNNRSLPRGNGTKKWANQNGNFGTLDQLIRYLDSRYDGLTNQAAWVTYNTDIEGKWALCTNCPEEVEAKYLYRQVNLNLYIQGLAFNDSPAGLTYTNQGSSQQIFYYPSLTPPAVTIDALLGGHNNTIYIFQRGWLLNNPIFYTVGLTSGAFYPNGSYPFDFFINDELEGDGPFCCALPNGAPGKQGMLYVQTV
jgi:hypothetical protein